MASSPADDKNAPQAAEGSGAREVGLRSEPAAGSAGGAAGEPGDAGAPTVICPRCQHRAPAPAVETLPPPSLSPGSDRAPPSRRVRAAEILRCPSDGAAMVSADVLAAADGDPFLGMTIAERFVIIGRLGAGSMGTVYRARQEAMGRDVAIKILRSDRAFDAHAKARFTREARAMSLLTSPHTVTVFDFGEIADDSPDADFGIGGGGGSLYLAMELLEGESLGHRLKRVRRLPVADAVRFARHALLSLAEAHDKGIIHRDLKPDNLFIAQAPPGEREEVCKVLDFGIAKVVVTDREKVDALETQAGTVFGTPRYMSPEQAQGKPLDARSDLYSLGVLLYQMLVGRPPFVDDDAVVVMARHIKSTPVPAIEAAPDAGIPRPLSDLLQRVLAKSPDDRPPSAHDFILELDRAGALPARHSERTAAAAGEVGATSELLAVVGDDIDAVHVQGARRPAPRSRQALLALAAAAALAIIAGLAVGGLRPSAPLREAQVHVARAAGARADAAARALAPKDPDPAPAPSLPVAGSASAAPDGSVAAPPGTAPSARAPRRPKPRKPGYEKFN